MDFHFNNWNTKHQHDNLGTKNSFLFATNGTVGHQSNGQIPYTMGMPASLPFGNGQPRIMTQKVTETRRAIFSPNGVQVHTVIDYSPIQLEPLSSLPLNQPMVTKTVRTARLLAPNLTMDRLFTVGPSSWNSPLGCEAVSSLNQQVDNPTNFGNGQNWPMVNVRDFVVDSSSVPSGQTQFTLRNMSLGLNGTTPSPSNLINPSLNLFNSEIASSDHGDENSDNDDDSGYDGRTHSLPTQRYGPYTCPKCKVVFNTSQCFAAHANSHYKFETKEERKRRLAAKQKKRRNVSLLHLGNGSVTAASMSGKAVAKALLRARSMALGRNDSGMKDQVKQEVGVGGSNNGGALLVNPVKGEPV